MFYQGNAPHGDTCLSFFSYEKHTEKFPVSEKMKFWVSILSDKAYMKVYTLKIH